MQSLSFRRAVARAILSIVVLAGAAACSDSVTSPAPRRPMAAVDAKLDDDPGPMPEETCWSGWQNVAGRWVCENP